LFLTSELKEEILQNFIYEQNPFRNFLSLVDLENYEAEDNITSDKQIEKAKAVDRLLQLLGFASPWDEMQIKKETGKIQVCGAGCKGPALSETTTFKRTLRFRKNLQHTRKHDPWANSLLEQFSLQIKAGEKTYHLQIQSELVSLISCKNKNGRIYKDSRNLLNQQIRKKEAEDLFIDEETKATKEKKQFNTERFDTGVKTYDEQAINFGICIYILIYL
jgi:hypothetical protein